MSSTKKFSTVQVALIVCVASAVTFTIVSLTRKKEVEPQVSTTNSCNINIKRLQGLTYIKPLMFVEEDCQSDRLASVRQQIIDIINRYQSEGNVTKVSLYLRDSGRGEWTGINEDEKYTPGSLLKVPLMMAVLKTDEDQPGFLDKKIIYGKPFPQQRFVKFPAAQSIRSDQAYTVRELLHYAIKYSDNNAALALEASIDLKQFQKVFTAVGLPDPNIYVANTELSPKEYSLFMRTIYNAGYLTIKDSEFAGELLSESQFRDGLVKGLPANVRIAHKFGEAGTDGEGQLHESAIIYLNNTTYLLTVMTKGKDYAKQSQLLEEISRAVYADMSNLSNS